MKLLTPYMMFLVTQIMLSYHAPTSKNFVGQNDSKLSEAQHPILESDFDFAFLWQQGGAREEQLSNKT